MRGIKLAICQLLKIYFQLNASLHTVGRYVLLMRITAIIYITILYHPAGGMLQLLCNLIHNMCFHYLPCGMSKRSKHILFRYAVPHFSKLGTRGISSCFVDQASPVCHIIVVKSYDLSVSLYYRYRCSSSFSGYIIIVLVCYVFVIC